MSSPQDSTLRATQVNVSVVDKSNRYQSMGRMILLAIRKSGQIQLIILRPDKKPLIGLPASPNINWAIQNDVYASMVGGNVRFLLQFANTQEAQLFTMLALSGRLAESPEPICIINKNGGPIAAEDRFTISYDAYDLNSDQLKGPSMSEKNMSLSSSDQTPFSAIAKSGTLNSTFIVKMSGSMISIVHSIGRSANPPPAKRSTETPEETEDTVEPQVIESSRPKDSYLEQEEQQKKQQQQIAMQIAASKGGVLPSSVKSSSQEPSTITSTTPKQAPPKTSLIPPSKKPVAPQYQQQIPKPQPSEPPKAQFDAQLQSIYNEMETKFNQLSQMISSLRRSHTSQASNIPLSSDVLVSSVQRLLRENQLKDQLIAEKQQLIDILNERHSDTRERDDLRVQLADLGSKLSSQRQITRAKTEKQDELNNEIEELQVRLAKFKKESEDRLSTLQQRLDEEKQKQLNDLDEQRKKVEANTKIAEEEVEKVREQFEKAMSENKVLKAQASRDISGELNKLKEQMPQLVMRTVKQMIQGVYGIVTNVFDDDEDYDGITVTKQIKRALETQAGRMLHQIDPQEDDGEGEEEEEEAEEDD
ncbi:hypothetical protein M9Y10_016426 [Tritrichomonas musculus]|uniref:Uncharacterized protein n=1 Tax=Tritrichomonas musculus TaxID=1915356 RepID=A0ABR2HWZ7_9EUKA